jgi:hypothetical protein
MQTGFAPRGIIPAMVTPFDRQGKINKSAIQKLTNYLIGVRVSFTLWNWRKKKGYLK